ncbi:unnamed protein product [Camellia sinensis]
MGRPKSVTPKFSLAPLVPRLFELLGIQVCPQEAEDEQGMYLDSMRLQDMLKYPSMNRVLQACVFSSIEAQTCKPSGKLRGKKPPQGKCNTQNQSECCKEGKLYSTFTCSPPVSARTKALLTINSFQKGGDGGGRSACDNRFHSDNKPVVALSTGWFNKRQRCLNNIIIHGNGRSVKAMVVDECDSTLGCDADHAFQPPCPNNIVDASKAVWKALGVPEKDWGNLDVTWSDA